MTRTLKNKLAAVACFVTLGGASSNGMEPRFVTNAKEIGFSGLVSPVHPMRSSTTFTTTVNGEITDLTAYIKNCEDFVSRLEAAKEAYAKQEYVEKKSDLSPESTSSLSPSNQRIEENKRMIREGKLPSRDWLSQRGERLQLK